jgi:hypothetical protein
MPKPSHAWFLRMEDSQPVPPTHKAPCAHARPGDLLNTNCNQPRVRIDKTTLELNM